MKKQRGMTILEVVVCMLIIGIGITVSISMLQKSMQNNVAALNRNNAIYLMESIAGKMRVNRFAAPAYPNYTSEDNAKTFKTKKLSELSFTPTDKSCPGNCTDNQKTAYAQVTQDFQGWYQDLQEKLPSGAFAIYPLGNDTYAIELRWLNQINVEGIKNSDVAKAAQEDSAKMVFAL